MMALSRTAKIWIIVLAIPVTVMVVGIIAAKLYFTADRLKLLVVPRLEQATDRHVSVKDLSLSVFPTLAISVDSLKISNPDGMKFDRNEFVSLENLRVHVHLLPLLTGNIEIGQIVMNHPRIYLEVAHNGAKNYSSKKAGAPSPPGTPSGRSMSGELLLSNIEISDGEIEYVNKKFDSRLLISGLHQIASAETHSGEHTIVVEGATSIKQLSYGTTSFWYLSEQPFITSEKIVYNMATDVLTLEDVTGKLKDLPLKISGTVSQLQQDTNIMDLTVTSPGVQMEHLLSLVPPSMLKKTQGLSSSGDVTFSVAIKGPLSETVDPGTRGTFSVTNGSIHYASLPKSITHIDLTGSFEKPSAPIDAKGIGACAIDKFSASLDDNTLGGRLSIRNFDDPIISAFFKGVLNLSDLKDFYPLEQGSEVAGTLKANVSIDGSAKSPQNLKAGGTIVLQNVTIKSPGSPKPLKNLSGTIAFSNQAIDSKQLAMNIGESDMNLSFTVKNYLGMVAATAAGKPSATVSLTSKVLRTEDLITEEGADAPGESSGKSPRKKGSMLPGIDIQAKVAIDKFMTKKFTFENAHGAVVVSNGVIHLQSMSVNAFQGTIQSTGTLDLRDDKKSPFNLQLDMKNVESNGLLSNFTSFGQYLYGKFSTSTTISGDLNDTLGLKTESLLGSGRVQIADGKLVGLPLMQKLSEFTSLADLRQVDFKNWTNMFSISNGRLILKDLVVHAGSTDFLAGGSQGLDGTMDYALTVKFPSTVSDRLQIGGMAGEILQFFKDKEGRINLPLNVSGTQSQPIVRLDARAQENAIKSALQQKGDDAKNKVQDDLKKKAEEALKKLFKRP